MRRFYGFLLFLFDMTEPQLADKIITVVFVQWQSVCVGSTPKIENIPDLYTNGVDTRNKLKRKFAESSFLPKTQTPFYVAPGNPPRYVLGFI